MNNRSIKTLITQVEQLKNKRYPIENTKRFLTKMEQPKNQLLSNWINNQYPLQKHQEEHMHTYIYIYKAERGSWGGDLAIITNSEGVTASSDDGANVVRLKSFNNANPFSFFVVSNTQLAIFTWAPEIITTKKRDNEQ